MRISVRRIGLVLFGVLIAAPPLLAADNQIRGFFGATFQGSTTFVPDLTNAANKTHLVFGGSFVSLGDMFGAEVELADAPGFFESGAGTLVLSSRVTTLTGNVVIAAPRRLMEYSLRPYFVGGGGLMRIHADDVLSVVTIAKVKPSFDLGIGVIGFLSNRVGLCWEVRRFQIFHQKTAEEGLTLGDERLSFWRATMALAYRY